MRQEIPLIVLGADGRPYAGASVTVRTSPGGADATVFQARTGGATSPNPLTSDAQGRVSGWLERGDYAATISSVAGLGPWVEEFPIGSQNDGHIELAEIPDGLIPSVKLTPNLRPSSLYRLGVHSARPGPETVEAGTVWRSTDKWMEWLSDGAAWTLISAEPQALATLPAAAPAAPASAPVDGQRVSLPWGKGRFIVRYNAGSGASAKWEVEGEGPAFTTVRNATGNVLAADGVISLGIPINPTWAGDYFVSGLVACRHNQANVYSFGAVYVNGVDVGHYAKHGGGAGTTDAANSAQGQPFSGDVTLSAGGQAIDLRFSTNANTTATLLADGRLTVRPLRIGPA